MKQFTPPRLYLLVQLPKACPSFIILREFSTNEKKYTLYGVLATTQQSFTSRLKRCAHTALCTWVPKYILRIIRVQSSLFDADPRSTPERSALAGAALRLNEEIAGSW